jgi:hypothetical protein
MVAAVGVVFVWHRDNRNQRGESILPSLDRSSAPTPKRNVQPGLWFMGGGLTQSRIYSKYVALQIKAIELGYISP